MRRWGLSHTASSFIASKLGSYRRLPNPLERGLPANEALRSVSHTASSFIAGKRAPTDAYLKCVGLDIKVI